MLDRELAIAELEKLKETEAMLRKQERALASQIRSLGEQFSKVLAARQKATARREALDRKFAIADGRVTELKTRQRTPDHLKKSSKNISSTDIEAIIAVATDESLSLEERRQKARAMLHS